MLSLLIDLGLLVVGTVLLLLGADWFMDGVRDLARSLGMSALVLGVILAGLEPEEMLTAALASGRGAPALAVGNVIGTNVTIVTLALGLSALIFPLVLELLPSSSLDLLPVLRECSYWQFSLGIQFSFYVQIARQSSTSRQQKR